jgi:hypothetical protein
MRSSDFVGYIGPADIHDGTILKVQHNGPMLRVLVKSNDGQLYTIEFDLVQSVTSVEPEGMTLYSLTEMTGTMPFRRFVFANWDEEGKGMLDVVAQQIEIRKIADEAAF